MQLTASRLLPTVVTGLISIFGVSAGGVHASEAPQAVTFEEARQRLTSLSDALGAAEANLRASESDAAATGALRRPFISLDAQWLQYQKTLELSLDPAKAQAQSAADQFIAGLPGLLPNVPPALVEQISGRLEQAIPGLLAGIPSSVTFKDERSLFHPTITAIQPLYTGGAIPAAQAGAKATAEIASAQSASTRDLLSVRLVQAYFGQQLAAHSMKVARDTRDGFDKHLDNALQMERQGVLSYSRRLQVTVARDTAQRIFERSEGEYRMATDALAILLRSEQPIETRTPLFVNSAALPPLEEFVDAAMSDHPMLRQVDAAEKLAQAGTKLASARFKPQFYAFGSYNLNRDDELLIEPDWIFGVGVHYSLLSNLDRRDTLAAARARTQSAQDAAREARVELRQVITNSYRATEIARRQFQLLQTNVDAARENLRIEEISFREGEATASDLIDARNTLGVAETQRAAAAYEYDLALAALMNASGQMSRYGDYIRSADQRITQ
jgi:outer membrane protein TolC